MWRLNNIPLKSDWVKEEIKGEIKRYVETNENDNVIHWNFCDAKGHMDTRGKVEAREGGGFGWGGSYAGEMQVTVIEQQ